ncbi:MAG: hypothetical protein IJD04_03090 [Desulfovibrionaceae bacterium]|nr:hypothetical protein [Desulfovibrionaceae bacterium]
MLGRLKNVTVIYSLDEFCKDGECAMFSEEGIPLYYDYDHLSYEGNRYLVERVLAPYLEEIAARP